MITAEFLKLSTTVVGASDSVTWRIAITQGALVLHGGTDIIPL